MKKIFLFVLMNSFAFSSWGAGLAGYSCEKLYEKEAERISKVKSIAEGASKVSYMTVIASGMGGNFPVFAASFGVTGALLLVEKMKSKEDKVELYKEELSRKNRKLVKVLKEENPKAEITPQMVTDLVERGLRSGEFCKNYPTLAGPKEVESYVKKNILKERDPTRRYYSCLELHRMRLAHSLELQEKHAGQLDDYARSAVSDMIPLGTLLALTYDEIKVQKENKMLHLEKSGKKAFDKLMKKAKKINSAVTETHIRDFINEGFTEGDFCETANLRGPRYMRKYVLEKVKAMDVAKDVSDVARDAEKDVEASADSTHVSTPPYMPQVETK